MATFADIIKHSDVEPVTWVDSTIPDGHFGATTRILGIITAYRLRGVQGDPDAVIVGRDEMYSGRVTSYEGAGLKGGSLVRHR
jgi:hypothetical protein